MRDDDYEWDDEKAAANLARHGVSFETARLAFDDPFSVSREDPREAYGEERYILFGLVDDRVLHVAYTFRGDRIRIVSARTAGPLERRRYHEGND